MLGDRYCPVAATIGGLLIDADLLIDFSHLRFISLGTQATDGKRVCFGSHQRLLMACTFAKTKKSYSDRPTGHWFCSKFLHGFAYEKICR